LVIRRSILILYKLNRICLAQRRKVRKERKNRQFGKNNIRKHYGSCYIFSLRTLRLCASTAVFKFACWREIRQKQLLKICPYSGGKFIFNTWLGLPGTPRSFPSKLRLIPPAFPTFSIAVPGKLQSFDIPDLRNASSTFPSSYLIWSQTVSLAFMIRRWSFFSSAHARQQSAQAQTARLPEHCQLRADLQILRLHPEGSPVILFQSWKSCYFHQAGR